jgi:hypothetical protein
MKEGDFDALRRPEPERFSGGHFALPLNPSTTPHEIVPQPEQIARLLARGSISTSSFGSTRPFTKRIRV